MTNDVKVHILHTGNVYIDRALAFREKTWHPMPYTGWFRAKAKKSWVPVSVYLIEHANGLILVDSGWHTDIRRQQQKHLGFLPYTMFKGELPQGQAVHEQLRARGITPRDLDFVVLSHLHADHVSGIRHVKEARRIIASRPEWDAAQKDFGYVRSMWNDVDIEPFDLEPIPYGPFKLGKDLWGDGSVYLVYTPGHSKGQLSLLVRKGDGWILLASDVGYAEESWEKMRLPGVTTDDEHARISLQWVRDFSRRADCIATIANHDPDIQPHAI